VRPRESLSERRSSSQGKNSKLSHSQETLLQVPSGSGPPAAGEAKNGNVPWDLLDVPQGERSDLSPGTPPGGSSITFNVSGTSPGGAGPGNRLAVSAMHSLNMRSTDPGGDTSRGGGRLSGLVRRRELEIRAEGSPEIVAQRETELLMHARRPDGLLRAGEMHTQLLRWLEKARLFRQMSVAAGNHYPCIQKNFEVGDVSVFFRACFSCRPNFCSPPSCLLAVCHAGTQPVPSMSYYAADA
jgi:hypothetical protein